MEKNLDSNYTRMLWAILNKSLRQHPTKQQLYGHLPPIMKTIKIRQTRHAGDCWRSRDELISDVLLWTPSHGRAKAGHPARTYMQQLSADTGCSPEDLLKAMDDRKVWQERVRNISADSVTYSLWSSGLHTVSSHSCCMYVRAGRPAFDWPYVGVHRSTSLMSSSLLLQQCPACLVRLTWIVFVMGGRWPYSSCLVGCCRQDLFNIVHSILVYLPSSFFSSRLVSVQVVHPYSSIDTTAAWKNVRFILSVRSDFHMIDSLLIVVHAFVNLVSMSCSVDETLLPR